MKRKRGLLQEWQPLASTVEVSRSASAWGKKETLNKFSRAACLHLSFLCYNSFSPISKSNSRYEWKKKRDEMLRNFCLSRSNEQIYQTIPSLTYIEKTRKRARIHYWWLGRWLATKAFCYTYEDSFLTQNDFVG